MFVKQIDRQSKPGAAGEHLQTSICLAANCAEKHASIGNVVGQNPTLRIRSNAQHGVLPYNMQAL